MSSALVVPTRRCAGPCGQTLPWHEFSPRAYWPDGSVRNVQPHCRKCAAEYRRKWRQENRHLELATERRYRARLLADPERAEQHRERARFNHRAWKDRQGITPRALRCADRSPSVDAAPFAAWLSMKVAEYGSVQAVATACGMSESRVTKVKNGGVPRVELSSVDAALQAEGSTMLDELGY